ncbi:MAG: HAMP domain-containing sensor histidine kinase, partial [Lentilitoribacter sp.]
SVYIPPMLTVRADSEQLYRVISNLVRNARQAITATKKPGDIIVAASETEDFWLIEITDTGPGLPKKAQEHLFTPFQGGVSKGGSGLGMAISEELVRGHGGTLSLQSTGEKGTIFCIKLPKGDVDLSK